MGIDYAHCWVCGDLMGPDKMHVLIDNGRVTRHVYCCRKHRYVVVEVPGTRQGVLGPVATRIQERTDLEIESLALAFRAGELAPRWE